MIVGVVFGVFLLLLVLFPPPFPSPLPPSSSLSYLLNGTNHS